MPARSRRWWDVPPVVAPPPGRLPGPPGGDARHGKPAAAAAVQTTTGKITTDRRTWSANVDGHPLDLTFMEFEVLDFLVRHPGRTHSRHDLLRLVWGCRGQAPAPATERAVDVLVARLRRKLGPYHRHAIETVRKVGYRYTPQRPGSTPAPIFMP